MIPHLCTVKHDPPKSYGDCFRACIASLFNMKDSNLVPHFYRDGDDEGGNAEFKQWLLNTFNMRPFYMALPGNKSLADIFAMMAGVNIGIEYLLFCQASGGDHVVICRDDQVIHDPSWYRSPIDGPSSNGFWVIMVVVSDNK